MKRDLRLVVFLVPPMKFVGGGILSIFSICETSRIFQHIHKSEVLMSTFPGHESFRKNDLFENDEIIYSFDEVVKKGAPEYLQIHIPEYATVEVFNKLTPYINYLKSIPDLRINILNQNILLMPKPLDLTSLFTLTPKVTQTTAHLRYTTQGLADEFNTPISHLSTFIDQHQYKWTKFKDKENIIVLSPDKSKLRASIIKKLSTDLPDYKFVVIKDMKYEAFKEVISKAKFSITFGEGFDGYFVEPLFCGTLSFAVYNDDFFPDKGFADFENTYISYNDMRGRIVKNIRDLESNQNKYEGIVKKNLKRINALYNFESYKKRIENFYNEDYSYTPNIYSGNRLVGEVIKFKNAILTEKAREIDDLNKKINTLNSSLKETMTQSNKDIRQRDETIASLTSSMSWKITKPLRAGNSIFTRKKR